MSARFFSIIGLLLLFAPALSSSARAEGPCAPRGVAASVVRELRQTFARFGQGIEEARRMALEIQDPALRAQFLERVLPLERINRTRMMESGGRGASLPGLELQRRVEFEMAKRGLSGPSLQNRALIQSIQVQVSELGGTLEYLAYHLRNSLSDPYFNSLPESRAAQRRLLAEIEQAIARGHLSYGESLRLSAEALISLDYYPNAAAAEQLRVRSFETIWQDGGFPVLMRTPPGATEFAFGDFAPGARGGLVQLRVTRFEAGANIAASQRRLPVIDNVGPFTDTEYAGHDLDHFKDLFRGGGRSVRDAEVAARAIARLRRIGQEGVTNILERALFIMKHEHGEPGGLQEVRRFLESELELSYGRGVVTLNRGGNVQFDVPRADVETTLRWLRGERRRR